MSKNNEKKPIMVTRKTAVTSAEKKAQLFRVGFVLVLVVVMLLTPMFINWLSRRDLDINWLSTTGTQIITNNEMSEILADNSDRGFFVYIGRASCPACQQFEPTLHATLAELELGLRHFQFEDALAEDEDVAYELLSTISDLAFASWRDRGGVPVIKLFLNGEIIDYLGGVQPQSVIIDFFKRNGGLN